MTCTSVTRYARLARFGGGIYDKVEDEYVLETTRNGVEVYAELMGLEV